MSFQMLIRMKNDHITLWLLLLLLLCYLLTAHSSQLKGMVSCLGLVMLPLESRCPQHRLKAPRDF